MNKLEELYDKYCTLDSKKNIDGNSKEALEAVKQSGHALAYISNPSEQVCLEAVRQNGLALAYISNPSEQVCLEAVKQDGLALAYINNPSEQVCLEAVKQSGHALQYINNPSEQVCLEAVKQREGALQYTPSHMFDSMISSLPDSLKLLSSSKVIRELAEKSLKKKI